MKKEFCTYEISLKLKDLGFVPNFVFGCYYNNQLYLGHSASDTNTYNDLYAPLWQQAIDWCFNELDFYYPYIKFEIFNDYSGSWYQPKDEFNDAFEMDFDSLEDAIIKCIKEIENLKQIKFNNV